MLRVCLLFASAMAQPPPKLDVQYRQMGLRFYQRDGGVELTHRARSGEAGAAAAAAGADHAEALRWFLKAVAEDPTNAVNHGYVGNAHFKMEQFDAAEAAFKAAISLAPAEPRYLSNLGSLYAQRGMYEPALQAFRAAKVLSPEDGTLSKNYDSTEMFWRFEEMVKELQSGGVGGHWDLEGFLDGRNYTEKVEVTFKFVMEQRSDMHPRGLELLRAAHARKPTFAAIAHLLANTLVDQHRAHYVAGEPAPLLAEARAVLEHSLARAAGAPAANDVCEKDGQDTTQIRLVAVSSSQRVELDRLSESARRCGFRLDVLGLGEPWRGLGSKIDLLTQYLDAQTDGLLPGDLLLFVDAYDVLLMPSARRIAQDFAEFEKQGRGRILFGAEVNCAPDAGARLVYPPSPTRFRFLNSGTYIGRVRDVRRMLTAVRDDVDRHHVAHGADAWRFDDQRWFSRFFLSHPRNATLDVGAGIFQTLHDLQTVDFEIEGQDDSVALYSPETRARPSLIHGNGNGIWTFHALSALLAKRGWPASDDAAFVQTSSPLPPLQTAAR